MLKKIWYMPFDGSNKNENKIMGIVNISIIISTVASIIGIIGIINLT
jgi:hypothetical protein